jgi:exodeoxyribonuclease III
MKIATFNANSIRSRLPVVIPWLQEHLPDILAIQETKVQDHEFPVDAFEAVGYHVVFKGQKSYNGVAIVSRRPLTDVRTGFFEGDDLNGPRLIRAKYGEVHIINTYVPQGRDRETEHYAGKLEWLRSFRRLLETDYSPSQPVIWLGDLNVAPEPPDVHDPQRLEGHVCFNRELTELFYQVCSWGFQDVFRKHHPEPEQYSFFDYRAASVYSNKGWRIDHILATPPLYERSTNAWIDMKPRKRRDPKPSDHTFVIAEFAV